MTTAKPAIYIEANERTKAIILDILNDYILVKDSNPHCYYKRTKNV